MTSQVDSTKHFSSVQFSSVTQSCLTFCNPMNHNTPGLPVHHQLPEFTQTDVHWVGDAIQPSHPLSSSSPPAPNPSQHQSFRMSQLFTWGGQSIGVSVLIGRIIVLQRCLCPDPWNRWTCFLTWQNRFYRGDERSWDGEIGLSKWPQYNHKGHIKERGR